jgi:two-component system OmpR family response regulator
VVLSGAEFRLLRVFVGHANKVLSREQLVALSSGRQYEAQDRAIDLQISRLRQKLGDSGGDGLIKTVRNEGYVLAAAVALE